MKDQTNLTGLDRIYAHVNQNHPYHLILYHALCLVTWAPNAYAILSINFTNAKPDYVDCGEHASNLTYAEYCRFKRFQLHKVLT